MAAYLVYNTRQICQTFKEGTTLKIKKPKHWILM